MNLLSLKERLSDLLVHHPFDCQDVFLYLVEHEKLAPADDSSAEFLSAYGNQVRTIAFDESPVSPIWYIGIRQSSVGGGAEGLCCGGCSVGSVTVIVSKRLEFDAARRPLGNPIDDYFLNAVQVRVAEILGIDLTKLARGAKTSQFRPPDVLSADLKALEVFETAWRRTYGENQWLAVKGGTVVAHASTRDGVEKQLRELAVVRPVLFVPPKKDERICEMFSIGL